MFYFTIYIDKDTRVSASLTGGAYSVTSLDQFDEIIELTKKAKESFIKLQETLKA